MKLIASALFLGALLGGSAFAACPCDESTNTPGTINLPGTGTDKGPESDPETNTD